mmetsp:Transcript_17869/g.50645  ORF Transcript_17869/g.50645 Transcript_17869/m.50645 type:complete len:233 (+) Transcript_17869:2589-3287(+)
MRESDLDVDNLTAVGKELLIRAVAYVVGGLVLGVHGADSQYDMIGIDEGFELHIVLEYGAGDGIEHGLIDLLQIGIGVDAEGLPGPNGGHQWLVVSRWAITILRRKHGTLKDDTRKQRHLLQVGHLFQVTRMSLTQQLTSVAVDDIVIGVRCGRFDTLIARVVSARNGCHANVDFHLIVELPQRSGLRVVDIVLWQLEDLEVVGCCGSGLVHLHVYRFAISAWYVQLVVASR